VYTIAITGRFGSGKTMISNILKEKGIFLLMVDEIAHDLYEKGTACWNQIIEYFGKSILNATGEIDRKTLGKIVFSDKKKLAKLNSVMFPALKERVIELHSSQIHKSEIIVIDCALLFEMQLDVLANEIWIPYVPESILVQRLKNKLIYSEESIYQRLSLQMTFETIVNKCQVVIDNKGSAIELGKNIECLWYSKILPKLNRSSE